MSDERRAESSRPAVKRYAAEEYRRDEWGWRWARGLGMNEEERRRRTEAERRAKRHREEFPGKVRVAHPKYGEVIVPGASPLAAIRCAADRWGCEWSEITDARVWAIEGMANEATSSVTADAVPPSPRGEGIKKSSRPGQGSTAKDEIYRKG